MKNKLLFGIDPGVKTGISLYHKDNGKLIQCSTMTICEAMSYIQDWMLPECAVEVYFEDARLRKWIPENSGREVLQGVGSVKRDSSIWQEFCELHKIEYHAVAPKDNMTKIDSELFKKITGWTGRTSEHARDSAMLVFGR
jgi:hypothetical protein